MEKRIPRATRVAESASNSPALKRKQARLVVESGKHIGRSIDLSDSRITIGRTDEAHIVFDDDDRVSRIHAELFLRPSGYMLRDLRSTNGTFVNGEPIEEELLSHGDRVTIGSQELRFVIEDDVTPKIYEIPQ